MSSYHLRICVPKLFPMILEVGENKMEGVFSEHVNTYIKPFEKAFNTTISMENSYPGMGNEINGTGMYDGCIGKLQRGEADLIASGVDYPMDIANVSQGFIIFDEKIAFSGIFARPGMHERADFSRSFRSFHLTVYLLILLYLVLFTLFLRVRRKLIREAFFPRSFNRHSSIERKRIVARVNKRFKRMTFSDVLRHFICSNFIEATSTSSKVCAMAIAVFSFFIFAHFNSLLNTELVVPEKALLYENYHEIMKAGVRPLFLNGNTYYKDLKYARKGTNGRRFWDWAAAKFGEENLFVDMDLSMIPLFGIESFAGQLLVFTGETISGTIKSTICGLSDRPFKKVTAFFDRKGSNFDWSPFEQSQVYTRTDDSAVSKIKSFVIGKKLVDSKKYFPAVRQLFHQLFEHGHFQGSIRYIKSSNALALLPSFESLFGPSVPERVEIKQICLQMNTPVPKNSKVEQLALSNLILTFSACLLLLICSFVIFLIQILLA